MFVERTRRDDMSKKSVIFDISEKPVQDVNMFSTHAGFRCGAILRSRQIKPFLWRDSGYCATLEPRVSLSAGLRLRSFSLDRNGYHVSWDAVPAWVCSQCGEPFFESREVDLIQKALTELDRESAALTSTASWVSNFQETTAFLRAAPRQALEEPDAGAFGRL